MLAEDDLPSYPGKIVLHLPQVSDRGREPDPLEFPGQQSESFQGDGQLGPSLVPGQFVDLIYDDPFDLLQMFAQVLSREHNLHGLRSGDEDLRRGSGLSLSFRLRGVSVSDSDGYAQLGAHFLHPSEHIPVEGSQRGDVYAADALSVVISENGVEYGQHGRFGLPDTGGCHH